MGHYFTNENLVSNIVSFKDNVLDQSFIFNTDNGVFSKGELDYGTRLLIETVLKENVCGEILDLGCGYGAIGIIIRKLTDSKITMIDINRRAVHLANMNIKKNEIDNIECFVSDGYENITKKYDCIISNPPIRVGKKILYGLLISSKEYLKENGVIYIVVRKEQGANSLIKDMQEFYNVNIINKSKGFFIISLK